MTVRAKIKLLLFIEIWFAKTTKLLNSMHSKILINFFFFRFFLSQSENNFKKGIIVQYRLYSFMFIVCTLDGSGN